MTSNYAQFAHLNPEFLEAQAAYERYASRRSWLIQQCKEAPENFVPDFVAELVRHHEAGIRLGYAYEGEDITDVL